MPCFHASWWRRKGRSLRAGRIGSAGNRSSTAEAPNATSTAIGATVHAVHTAARCALALLASHAPVAHRRPLTAGRDTAPSGAPARHGRVGGEGTRLRCALCAPAMVLAALRRVSSRLAGRFFASRIRPLFFVASVVAPPESLIDETAPQKTGGNLGY